MEENDRFTPHRRRADTRGTAGRSSSCARVPQDDAAASRQRRSAYASDEVARARRSVYEEDEVPRTRRPISEEREVPRARRSSSTEDEVPRARRSAAGEGDAARMRRSAAEGSAAAPHRRPSTSQPRQTGRDVQGYPTRQTAVRRSISQARADAPAQREGARRRSDAPAQREGARRRADDYSRRRYAGEDSAAAPSRKKLSKRTLIIAGVAAILVLAIIGGAAFACSVSGNLHAGITQDLRNVLVKTDMANEPFYLLLMGTDGSAERDEDPEYAGGQYRSDSIMLARIDAPNKKVTLLSIHRDTRVNLGPDYGTQKINAARAVGGPALAVETVAKMAGVDISHYAEINFDGFATIVDAIGGVEVDVPVDIEDWDAGGVLSAGVQTLNGEQALILCRSRNTYTGVAGDPDQMRAANQRLVLSAIAKKLLASDIGTIANTVREVSKFVTTDLELNDIIGLAQAMQGLDPESDIYTAMQPAGAVYENDIWWSVTDEKEWSKMMDRVKQGLPPTEETQIDEMTGTVLATAGGEVGTSQKTAWVNVKNGTPREGLASSAAETLNKAGFVNVAYSSANADTYRETLIVYDDPAQVYGANQIREALGQGRVMLNDGDYIYDGNFLVLIGSDWK